MKIDIKKHKEVLNQLWSKENLYSNGKSSKRHKKEALALLHNKLFIADIEKIRKEFSIEFTDKEKERLHAYYSEGSLQEIAEDFGDRSEIYFAPERLDEHIRELAEKYLLSPFLIEAVKEFILLDAPLVKWPKEHEVKRYEPQKGFTLPSQLDYLKSTEGENFRVELKDGRLFIEIFYYTELQDISGDDKMGQSIWKTRIEPLKKQLIKPIIESVALEDDEIEMIKNLWEKSQKAQAEGKRGISYKEMADAINDMRLQRMFLGTHLQGKSRRDIREAANHDKGLAGLYEKYEERQKSIDAIGKDIKRMKMNSMLIPDEEK